MAALEDVEAGVTEEDEVAVALMMTGVDMTGGTTEAMQEGVVALVDVVVVGLEAVAEMEDTEVVVMVTLALEEDTGDHHREALLLLLAQDQQLRHKSAYPKM